MKDENKVNSGLFMYVDLHAHPNQEGVFTYGNHFENAEDQIEALLLPKLMSLNCANFHFSSCDFSLRNMYMSVKDNEKKCTEGLEPVKEDEEKKDEEKKDVEKKDEVPWKKSRSKATTTKTSGSKRPKDREKLDVGGQQQHANREEERKRKEPLYPKGNHMNKIQGIECPSWKKDKNKNEEERKKYILTPAKSWLAKLKSKDKGAPLNPRVTDDNDNGEAGDNEEMVRKKGSVQQGSWFNKLREKDNAGLVSSRENNKKGGVTPIHTKNEKEKDKREQTNQRYAEKDSLESPRSDNSANSTDRLKEGKKKECQKIYKNTVKFREQLGWIKIRDSEERVQGEYINDKPKEESILESVLSQRRWWINRIKARDNAAIARIKGDDNYNSWGVVKKIHNSDTSQKAKTSSSQDRGDGSSRLRENNTQVKMDTNSKEKANSAQEEGKKSPEIVGLESSPGNKFVLERKVGHTVFSDNIPRRAETIKIGTTRSKVEESKRKEVVNPETWSRSKVEAGQKRENTGPRQNGKNSDNRGLSNKNKSEEMKRLQARYKSLTSLVNKEKNNQIMLRKNEKDHNATLNSIKDGKPKDAPVSQRNNATSPRNTSRSTAANSRVGDKAVPGRLESQIGCEERKYATPISDGSAGKTKLGYIPNWLRTSSKGDEKPSTGEMNMTKDEDLKKIQDQMPVNNNTAKTRYNYYHKRNEVLKGCARVAVTEATGLVRSYTLECNYNSGRVVNVLPPCVQDPLSSSLNQMFPPRYTPEIYADVGRALAVSILDLTDSNPWSRVLKSCHRSLTGLRVWLKGYSVPGRYVPAHKCEKGRVAARGMVEESQSNLYVAPHEAVPFVNFDAAQP